MKPFSAMYFIKENKGRCALLIFLLFLGFAAYLGGLYFTNPYDNWGYSIGSLEKYTLAYPSYSDEELSEFTAFKEEIAKNGRIKTVPLGEESGPNWKTVMGFESGSYTLTFRSVGDFKTFCEYMDIGCEFEDLKNGSLIMNERFAKNRGFALGDRIDGDNFEGVYGSYTLDALTDEDGYTFYAIDDREDPSHGIMIFDGKDPELHKAVRQACAEHEVRLVDAEYLGSRLESQYAAFYMIYALIIVLMSVILAVTVNAAFVGMYRRRNVEFAVYRAIGVPRRRIIGKITAELLCMDAIALTAGGALFFIWLYLFNELVLYPSGKYLRYFHPAALGGLLFCNLMTIFPLAVTRSRNALKADICEY